MELTINKKQIGAIAKAFDVKGLGYLQKVDLIAVALGFKNQAALMSAFGKDEVTRRESPKITKPAEFRFPEPTFIPTKSGTDLNPARRIAVRQHVLDTMSTEDADLFLRIVAMQIQDGAGRLEIAQEVVDLVKSVLSREDEHGVFRSGVRIDAFLRNLDEVVCVLPQNVQVPEYVRQFAEGLRSEMTIGESIKLVELMSEDDKRSALLIDVVKRVEWALSWTLRFENDEMAFRTGMTIRELKQKIREIVEDEPQV